ncbi:hypothetical protein HHK36_004858 [Tetracentron sinense]|uniref:Sm domain-containing protein n=1 Tax=Tetracentron sinense TaxID=13715 RepID=A0A834ZK87_TETSI|nr:hypothetical protein HHK36_004858 [Tetracentron sinense]
MYLRASRLLTGVLLCYLAPHEQYGDSSLFSIVMLAIRQLRVKLIDHLFKHSTHMEQPLELPLVQPESSDGSNPDNSSSVSRTRKLLFRRMLVGVNDGRFFLGAFHCIDKQGNIILQDAVEYRSIRRSSPSPMEQRCLGLVLIPSSCQSSCHVDCSIEEQLSLLSIQK